MVFWEPIEIDTGQHILAYYTDICEPIGMS